HRSQRRQHRHGVRVQPGRVDLPVLGGRDVHDQQSSIRPQTMTVVTTTPPHTWSLTQRAVRGAAWTLPTSVATRGVGLLGTLLIARYLSPNEYGVVMAASIAATTASSVTTFGVGTYLVANAEISRADTFHASCWFLATGVVALAVTLLLAEPLGRWSD